MVGGLYILLRVSRPRFWLYLGGTYAVGYAAGADELGQFAGWTFLVHLAFFMVPANLLLYGLNDLCDRETDSRNPKKSLMEHRLRDREVKMIGLAVVACGVLGVGLAVAQPLGQSRWLTAVFLLLCVLYSAPPIRLKARPFLDSASNALYIIPGLVGYLQSSGEMASLGAVIACAAWTAAMHLYSAVPDIESDSSAGVNTTATLLGYRNSLLLCAALWAGFAFGAFSYAPLGPWGLLALVYPFSSAVLAFREPVQSARFYWRFPLINGVLGMVGFFVLIPGR